MPIKHLRRWLIRILQTPHAYLVVIGLFYASILLSLVVQYEVWSASRCQGHWADAFTARTERLTTQNAELTMIRQHRDDQLAHLITQAIHGQKATKPELDAYVAAVASADKAEAAYQQALANNPVPAAPKYTC